MEVSSSWCFATGGKQEKIKPRAGGGKRVIRKNDGKAVLEDSYDTSS